MAGGQLRILRSAPACRNRDAAERGTASPRCELQRAELEFGKTAERESKKRPAPEATTEDKKTAAATRKLASNAPVTDSDIDALLPDQGYETLAKPAAPEKKNAAVTDADLDALLPDEGFQVLTPPKNDAQPKG